VLARKGRVAPMALAGHTHDSEPEWLAATLSYNSYIQNRILWYLGEHGTPAGSETDPVAVPPGLLNHPGSEGWYLPAVRLSSL
jgi:hypothetical protein